jgi:hypothetical protein
MRQTKEQLQAALSEKEHKYLITYRALLAAVTGEIDWYETVKLDGALYILGVCDLDKASGGLLLRKFVKHGQQTSLEVSYLDTEETYIRENPLSDYTKHFRAAIAQAVTKRTNLLNKKEITP